MPGSRYKDELNELQLLCSRFVADFCTLLGKYHGEEKF